MTVFTESLLVDTKFMSGRDRVINPHGKLWTLLASHLVGTTDLRARSGKWTTPWDAPSDSRFAPPKLEYISDDLASLHDRRALELFAHAKQTNKKIMVLWSGGIDSTAVLSSFIKNIPQNELKDYLAVTLSTVSIFENFGFYSKFISNKLECHSYSSIEVDNEFLRKYILIHGDPGDCLYGPSVGLYMSYIQDGRCRESYKKHIKDFPKLFTLPENSRFHNKDFGDWYVNKITDNLLDVNPDNVESVGDWFWWTYFNFKWEFSIQRPFYFNRKDLGSPLDLDLVDDYIENSFYNTDKFQLWSYSNLKNLIVKDRSTHKLAAKQYIFELDKNQAYFENKIKIAGAPANIAWRMVRYLPMYYDKDWRGHWWYEPGVTEECLEKLNSFQG